LRPDADLEDRLRHSLRARADTFVLAHPDEPPTHVIPFRQRRSRRWVAAGVAAAVLVLVGILLSPIGDHPSNHHSLAVKSPAARPHSSSTSLPPMSPSIGRPNGGPSPRPRPCPSNVTVPTIVSGQYCGPVPPAGNGLGAGGTCTGLERTIPCGAGVTTGKYYAYTMPGTCNGLITFNGQRWVSELPPPTPIPDFNVWISIRADGAVRFISPTGQVSFAPYLGQSLNECSASTTTTPSGTP
jgi:hypothetical protein